jgi:O-methyltransferase domain/Dimerisation domain
MIGMTIVNGTNKTEADPAPAKTLLPMITGFMMSQAIGVAVQLNLADLLAKGPLDSDALALQTQTHAPSLRRLLRALAGAGLVEELACGRFDLTPLGAQLRTGVSGSLRNFALMFCGERAWRSWGDLIHSVRTGTSAAEHLYGMSGFAYFARHPEAGSVFNAAMAEATEQVAAALVGAHHFSRFGTIVDVGGGNGALLTAILAAFPQPRGIVFDLPKGSEGAAARIGAAGLGARCQVVEGDFFQSVPSGGDAYLLKAVIHDWPDDRSVGILQKCRHAMTAQGTLLLIERVMPERIEATATHRQITLMDLNMMVMPGGRERTEAEFKALLESAGFRWIATQPLGVGGYCTVEAVPA